MAAAVSLGTVGVLGLALAGPAAAGAETGCAAADYRALDFRLGEFDVWTADGVRAGQSRVEAAVGGCALVEHWHGAVSGDGQALMYLDRAAGRWKLVFVNSEGQLLQMSGRFVGKALVLESEDVSFDGRPARQRMTWSPAPGGVRQVWERSFDGGASWQPFFEGRYRRRPGR